MLIEEMGTNVVSQIFIPANKNHDLDDYVVIYSISIKAMDLYSMLSASAGCSVQGAGLVTSSTLHPPLTSPVHGSRPGHSPPSAPGARGRSKMKLN